MMLIVHIATALVSVAWATALLVRPSSFKFVGNYALAGLTVASGTYLVVTKPAHMLETCTMGLAYLGFVTVATVVAARRLATAKARRPFDS